MTYKIIAEWKEMTPEVIDWTEDEDEAKLLVQEYAFSFCVGIQGSKCKRVLYAEE